MEPKIRGYAIPLTARFILNDEGLRSKVAPAVLEQVTAIANAKPELWEPRARGIFLWSVIDEASPDEASAYQNLVRCGQALADDAISTFLKLLLKMLTPKQFARKFPDIWAHEHTGGFVEAVLGDRHDMKITVRDVDGFRHVGPIGAGFVVTALTATGLQNLKVRDTSWTRARPDPTEVRIEISWT